MITTADGGHTPLTPTIVTLAKVEPGGRIPRQLSVGGAAHLTRHVRHNILAKQTLNVLWDILAADDETLVAVDAPLRTKAAHPTPE